MKKKLMVVFLFLVLVAFNLFPVEFMPGFGRTLRDYVLDLASDYGVPYRFVGYAWGTVNWTRPAQDEEMNSWFGRAALYESADVFVRGTVLRGFFPVSDDVIKKYVAELQAENFTLDWKDPFHSAYIVVRRFADLWEHYYGAPPAPYQDIDTLVADVRSEQGFLSHSYTGTETALPPFTGLDGSVDSRWLKVVEAYLGGTGPVDRGEISPQVRVITDMFFEKGTDTFWPFIGRGDDFFNRGSEALQEFRHLVKDSGFLPVK
jgi:hypothetical protein